MRSRKPSPRFKKFMQAARTKTGRNVVNLQIVKIPEQLPALVFASVNGDHNAQCLRRAINTWLTQLSKASPGKAALCGNCDHEFSWSLVTSRPAAFVIATPYAGKQDTAIVTGLCEACVKRAGDDLPNLVLMLWRKLMPNAEVLTEGSV
jgi:ribosomal silencing factor RsfS